MQCSTGKEYPAHADDCNYRSTASSCEPVTMVDAPAHTKSQALASWLCIKGQNVRTCLCQSAWLTRRSIAGISNDLCAVPCSSRLNAVI